MRNVTAVASALLTLVAIVALFVLLRHVGLLLEVVTVGPAWIPIVGATQGMFLFRTLDSMGLGTFITSDAVILAGATLTLSGALLAAKVDANGSNRHAATVVLQASMALSILAYSYRFIGLLAFSSLFVWQVLRRPGLLARWLVFALGLALCVTPFDISARNLEGRARFETSLHCMGEVDAQEYLANKRVCVCSDGPIYNEPTSVWVW